jgi:hypothetical protein
MLHCRVKLSGLRIMINFLVYVSYINFSYSTEYQFVCSGVSSVLLQKKLISNSFSHFTVLPTSKQTYKMWWKCGHNVLMGRDMGVNGINEINVRSLKNRETNTEHFLQLSFVFWVYSVCRLTYASFRRRRRVHWLWWYQMQKVIGFLHPGTQVP